MNRTIVRASFILLAVAVPAAAQQPEPILTVTPQVGVHLSATTLYRVSALFPRVTYRPAVSKGSLGPGLVVGADVEAALLPGRPLYLRLGGRQVLFSTGTMDGEVEPLDPDLPVETWSYDFDANITMITADLVLRPRIGAGRARGQLLLGVGLKYYSFGEAAGAEADTVNFVFPASGGSGTVHVGAGMDIAVGSVTLNIGAHDYINTYSIEESLYSEADVRTQHTVLVTAGVLFPLGRATPASARVPLPSRR